jgi:hypothetical protein
MNARDQHGTHSPTDAASRHRQTGDEPMSVTTWAHGHAPHLGEVSNSNPNATWRRHNLAAITDDLEVARSAALDFERAADAVIVTLTVEDQSLVDTARQAVAAEDRVRIVDVDAQGKLIA